LAFNNRSFIFLLIFGNIGNIKLKLLPSRYYHLGKLNFVSFII